MSPLIRPHFLRRLKVDYLRDRLPKKHEIVVWTDLSDKQRSEYTNYLGSSTVDSIFAGTKTSPLEAITYLKKLCGHPFLIEPIFDGSRQNRSQLIQGSAKLQVLSDLIAHLAKNGHRTPLLSLRMKVRREICKLGNRSSILLQYRLN